VDVNLQDSSPAGIVRRPKTRDFAILCGLLKLLVPSFVTMAAFAFAPDANELIRRSAEVLRRDWQAASEYDHLERDLINNSSRTWRVMMILGSPYSRLEAIDGVPLTLAERQKEQQKLDKTVARRCSESQQQTEQRIRDYQKDRQRDSRQMAELASALVFTLEGDEIADGHAAWLLYAAPRPGYRPPDREARVLTGMQGKLWIDKATFEWVKVTASVVHPVSIDGFLAKVEPGTEFELLRAPGPAGVWLNKHFSVTSKAKILSLIAHDSREDVTYSDYERSSFAGPPGCSAHLNLSTE
jgi:hypothetical protein